MAAIKAVASGNASAGATWGGGVVPGVGDTAYSNGYTVTVDSNWTVGTVTNASGSGITAGGGFELAAGVTLTAAVVGGHGTTAAVTMALASPNAATVVGALTGGGSSNFVACRVNSSGALSVVGNVRAGAGTAAYGLQASGNSSTVSVVGNVGNISDGQVAFHVSGIGAVVSITGNVVACNNSAGISLVGSGVVCTVTGNVSGGLGSGSGIVQGSSANTVYVYGTLAAGLNSNALAQGSAAFMAYLTGPFLNGQNGVVAALLYKWAWLGSPVSSMRVSDQTLTGYRYLYTADSVGGNPAIADVRSGTVYGPASELTGTLAVPPPGAVGLGVPTDNTTGTAAITQQTIADAVGPLIAAYGS